MLIVWPSLPGHTTDDVATGPVDVAIAAELVFEAALETAAEEAAEELETTDDGAEPPSLAPQIPLFVLGVP